MQIALLQELDRFLDAKRKADTGAREPREAANALIDAFHALTSLRALLVSNLSSGMPICNNAL